MARIPVVIQNSAPVPRQRSWCTIVVPSAHVAEHVAVHGHEDWPCLWGDETPAGRKVHIRPWYLEGSQRFEGELALGPVDTTSPPAELDLVHPPSVGEIASPKFPAIAQLVIAHGKNSIVHPIAHMRTVSQTPAATLLHHSERIARTTWVANLWVQVDTAALAARFELLLTAQDPLSTVVTERWDTIRLEGARTCARSCPSVVPVADELIAKGGTYGGEDGVTLSRSWWVADAQSLAYFGRLVFADAVHSDNVDTAQAESIAPLVGMVGTTGWAGSWGPWGVVPRPHPTLDTAKVFHVEHTKWAQSYNVPGTPYQNALLRGGLNDVPSNTGAQHDFGVTKLLRAFLDGGNPAWLLMLQASIAREVGRPSMFHEIDGGVLADDHDDLVTWGFGPHYDQRSSPDQLKIVYPRSWRTQQLWYMDWAHTSINMLAGWTILTDSELGKHVLRQLLTLALKREWLGQERAHGRVPLAVAWIWRATKDERCADFADWLFTNDRYDKLLEDYAEKKPVSLFFVNRDSWRVPYWMPWQQGLHIAGFDALSQCFPNDRACSILEALCTTHVREAWTFWRNRWTVGIWHQYLEDGSSLPENHYDLAPEMSDPHWPGTAYDQWSHAAAIISARWTTNETREKARSIHSGMHRDWLMAEPTTIDAYPEWTAVR